MTVHALRSSREAQRQERLKLGTAWQDSGFVFVHEDEPVSPEWIMRDVQAAVTRCGPACDPAS